MNNTPANLVFTECLAMNPSIIDCRFKKFLINENLVLNLFAIQKEYVTQQRRKANIDALVNFYVVMSKARNYNQVR